jgi:hypothetical protein
MLKPHSDRLDYGALLIPPEGFTLAEAVGTTYSLDLDALVSIPVALYFSHSLDVDAAKNLVPLLEAIRRAGTRVRVFCQQGQIKVPASRHRLYAFLEPCVVEVPHRLDSSFHPKVWVLRYADGDSAVRFRVIILSRNLTFDRSWDVAFAMDGETPVDPGAGRNRNTRPLVDFLAHLYEKVPAPEWWDPFLESLARTPFRLDLDSFDDFEFLPVGFGKYRSSSLFENRLYDELVILSPFVTERALELARNHCRTQPELFSRETELRNLTPKSLQEWTVWHLAPEAVAGETALDAEDAGGASDVQDQDLHAKVYCYKQGWDAHLVLGSLNCSSRGLFKNTEFLIRLSGKDSRMGPAKLKGQLLSEDSRLFERFDPGQSKETDEEKAQREIEARLDRKKSEMLIGMKMEAKAQKQPDGNFAIHAVLDSQVVTGDSELALDAWFFPHESQAERMDLGGITGWTVANVAEMDLCRLLILKLQHRPTGLAIRFAVQTDILGIPEGRDGRIFRHLISNSANLLKYLSFLLAENPWDEIGFEDVDGTKGDPAGGLTVGGSGANLYEDMLVAASRNPEKLGSIRDVLRRLEAEGEDAKAILPPDLVSMWHVFSEFAPRDSGRG